MKEEADQVQSASRNRQQSGKTVMRVRFAALLPIESQHSWVPFIKATEAMVAAMNSQLETQK